MKKGKKATPKKTRKTKQPKKAQSPKKVVSTVKKKKPSKARPAVKKAEPQPSPKKKRFPVFGILLVVVAVLLVGRYSNEIRGIFNFKGGEKKAIEIQKPAVLVNTETSTVGEEKSVVFSGAEKEPLPEWQSYFVNFSFLNIRGEPSIKAEIIETIGGDDEVMAIPTDNPEWFRVLLADGKLGFAAKRYLSLLTHDIASERGLYFLPILMYHYVSVPPAGSDDLRENLSVSPSLLGEQLKYLAEKGYTTVTFKDLQSAKDGRFPLPEKPVILTFDDGYIDHYTNVFPLLKNRNQKAVFFIMTDRVGQEGYMNWDQINEMSNAGMEIGSHAKSDVDLRYVSEKDGISQITDSKKVLEEKLGKPVYSFAYPSGRYTAWLFKVLSGERYAFARTTQFGKYVDVKAHPYTLPSLRISQNTTEEDFASWGIR